MEGGHDRALVAVFDLHGVGVHRDIQATAAEAECGEGPGQRPHVVGEGGHDHGRAEQGRAHRDDTARSEAVVERAAQPHAGEGAAAEHEQKVAERGGTDSGLACDDVDVHDPGAHDEAVDCEVGERGRAGAAK